MHRLSSAQIAIMAGALLLGAHAFAQMPPGGGAQMPGRPSSSVPAGIAQDESTPPSDEKPDVAARKAYKEAMKSFNKARELEAASANGSNPDKKAKAIDEYNKALDKFTEALSNKGDMVEAWDNVGYVHLRLGAYAEAVDDYNHALALKPDLEEAVAHRADAYLALDRLEEAKAAYMELFNHSRPLADQLMLAMQKWLSDHRTEARGMRPADIAAFEKWLLERGGIAKQTASMPH